MKEKGDGEGDVAEVGHGDEAIVVCARCRWDRLLLGLATGGGRGCARCGRCVLRHVSCCVVRCDGWSGDGLTRLGRTTA